MAAAYTTGFKAPSRKTLIFPDPSKYIDKKTGGTTPAYDAAIDAYYNNSPNPDAVKYRTDELTKKYGKLTDDQGKPLFNDMILNALASGTYPATYLDAKVKSWAENKIVNSSNYADILKDKGKGGGINSLAYQGVLQSLMTSPLEAEKFTYPKTYTDKITTAAEDIAAADTVVDTAAESDAAKKATSDTATADALATAQAKQKATKFDYTIPKLTAEEALASYNPDKGIWHGASTTNSPFGATLQGLIAGYKNSYAPDNTNPTASEPIKRVGPVIYHAPELTNDPDTGKTVPSPSGKPATPKVVQTGTDEARLEAAIRAGWGGDKAKRDLWLANNPDHAITKYETAIGNYKPVVPPVVPKVETPKVDVPKVELPKVEVPKTVEVPKVEVPKTVEDPRWGGTAAEKVAYAQDWLKANPNAPATSIANMKGILENQQYEVQRQQAVAQQAGIAALDPHYVPTISGGLSGYMTYDNDKNFIGFIKDDQKGTNLDPYVAQQSEQLYADAGPPPKHYDGPPITPYVNPAMQNNGSGASEEIYSIGPNSAGIAALPSTQQQAAAQQAAAQQPQLTLTAPASGPTYTLGGQGPTYFGPAVTAAQQQQTVVETDAERIARQQASIAALEASYPQQFSLTATQPQQQPTYSGIAAPTAVTTNNQLTLAQPQQQYTLGPQVPQQTSLQAFGDRAREINTIQNGFTSAADASAYEAAHPGYTNNVYTP